MGSTAYSLNGQVPSITNKHLSPSASDMSGEILRFYQAFFGRYPDQEGANFWIESYLSGRFTKDEIVSLFAGGPEFSSLYDGVDNREFVKRIYENVLDRQPDPSGWNYWTGRINQGLSRRDAVKIISDQPEFRSRFPYEPARLRVLLERIVSKNPNARVIKEYPGIILVRFSRHGSNVTAAICDLEAGLEVSVSPLQKQEVGHYMAHIDGTVSINANWSIAAPQRIEGPAMHEGQLYGGADHSNIGFVGFGSSQTTGTGFAFIDLHSRVNSTLPSWVNNAVAGRPTLVWQGQLLDDPIMTEPSTFRLRHPRTAVGLGGQSTLVLVTVDGRSNISAGMSATQTGETMMSLGCHCAMMLDGGGSTQMTAKGLGVVNRPSQVNPYRKVANELVVKSREGWY